MQSVQIKIPSVLRVVKRLEQERIDFDGVRQATGHLKADAHD